MNCSIKAIIFDMDGVLVDSEPVHEAAELEVMKSIGLTISEEEHKSFVGTTDAHIWKTLKEKYSLSQTVEELIILNRNKYFELIKNNIKPMPCVLELIPKLCKRLPLAVASSSTMQQIELITSTLGIKKYFRTLVSGEHINNSKPAPDIFLEAAKQLGVEPVKCLVVEDSYNGILAAKRAGMKALAVPNERTKHFDFSIADYVISNLKNFREEFLT